MAKPAPPTQVRAPAPSRPPPPVTTDPGLAAKGAPLGDGVPENTESRAARRRKFQAPADAEAIERQRTRKRNAAWVLGSVAALGIVWLETRPIPHYGPLEATEQQQVEPGGTPVKAVGTPDEFDPSAPVAPDEFDPSKPDPVAPGGDDLTAPKGKRGGSKAPKGSKRGR